MDTESTTKAPVSDESTDRELLSREEIYSPEFISWLGDRLFIAIDDHLRKLGMPETIIDSLNTLEILRNLRIFTLRGDGSGYPGASEYVARATRLIDELGGSFY